MTELLGGEFYLDLVYDPAYYVFSTAKIGISYHYGDTKTNIFEISVQSQGRPPLLCF